MKNEIVYANGKELVGEKRFLYFNRYKYHLTEKELVKLEDTKTYVLFQKYGLLFIKPIYGEKSVIVKRGEKVPKKMT